MKHDHYVTTDLHIAITDWLAAKIQAGIDQAQVSTPHGATAGVEAKNNQLTAYLYNPTGGTESWRGWDCLHDVPAETIDDWLAATIGGFVNLIENESEDWER